MNLKTIIVEDEPLSMQYICSLLSAIKEIQVLGKAYTEEEAVTLINNEAADLVFLDVELHTGNGFEVLKRTWNNNYQVVFTTAINHHALNILKLSGVPLLQKPLDFSDLETLIHAITEEQTEHAKKALQFLLETLNNNDKPVHILLEKGENSEYIEIENILKIKAAKEHSIVYLQNGETIPVIKNLRHYESLLESFSFFRANAEELINLQKVVPHRQLVNHILMTDGSDIEISPKKKELFVEAMNNLNLY